MRLPLFIFLLVAAVQAENFSPEQVDFFEKRIRPILSERCYKCHSAGSEKIKGELLLDGRSNLLKGGESGPGVVPGDPEKSRLILAIRYENQDLQMPPKGKLSPEQIADFVKWVKDGVAWGLENKSAATVAKSGFDLEKRRAEHWAWKPISTGSPPPVKDRAWVIEPPDAFVLSKLEEKGLDPAKTADKRTLLRRVTYDLTGLPPTVEELNAFVADESETAYAKVVNGLLESSGFGERWARHWLDLVRYSETLGHEFDYQIHDAWRYRDYVIRAFNSNVPHDKFVMEQVAGDLVTPPRVDPLTGDNDSVIGTTFYWMGQQSHSPVDVKVAQADMIENQIDVLTKTFLGMTVACARCHDHKFDAISTKDYYALYGILESSRFTRAQIDSPERILSNGKALAQFKKTLQGKLAENWLAETKDADAVLAAVRGGEGQGVEVARVERWKKALEAWGGSGGAAVAWKKEDVVLFSEENAGRWFAEGPALTLEKFEALPWSLHFATNGPASVRVSPVPGWTSAGLSTRLQGTLRSPTFKLTKPYLHIRAAGKSSRVNLVLENYTLIRSPIYGSAKVILNSEQPRWHTIDVKMWQGLDAYLEFNDTMPADPADDRRFSPVGYFTVQDAGLSDQASAPATAKWEPAALGGEEIRAALESWKKRGEPLPEKQRALMVWLVQSGLVSTNLDGGADKVGLLHEYRDTEADIPEPIYVTAMTEGTGEDEQVFIRGNPKNKGEAAPRRLLEALHGKDAASYKRGTGRLQLAEELVSPVNPLLPRVMVNWVWSHLFGEGIVASVDNFGVLGQKPTHPELLDWLAGWYRSHGWSTKDLIRMLVMSQTYRMETKLASREVEEKDPANFLLHRMRQRRLEGEAIRDGMLAVAGRFNGVMGGESEWVHLTPFMEGRGRPGRNGPADGHGRRSIYLEVRRNFLSPMMVAFDTPQPFTTVGHRTVSNVPAQALIMMNDPFVQDMARAWAEREMGEESNRTKVVANMYLRAFSRLPDEVERAEAERFLAGQENAAKACADLGHVLFNSKEFIYIN